MKYLPRILQPLLLLAITALVFLPGLRGDFLFDDYPNIVTNERVHLEEVNWEGLRSAARAYEPAGYGRPLATVSFAIDYAIGGKAPFVFKLTSLLVHLANCLLVFWLVRRLLSLPRVPASITPAAAFPIALIWAIHPLQVSTVLYVVQRMETLSLTFVLLALIAYLAGRSRQANGRTGWPWLVVSGGLAMVGMLSKESAVLFPAYALALELTLLRFEASSPSTSRAVKAAYLLGIGLAVLVFAAWLLPRHLAPGVFDGRDFTLQERLLTQLRVLPMYLGQMLLPLPSTLIFYYDALPKSTGLMSPPSTLLGGMLLLSLLACAWRFRHRAPLAALGIFWFFAAHLLTSNIFALELAFEHRNYFALLGIILVAVDLASRLRLTITPQMRTVIVTVFVVGLGLLSLLRTATWGDPVHLAMDLVAKSPDSPRASSDLATLFVGMSDSKPESPFFAMGAKEFERGAQLKGSSPLPEQGLILMAATTGQPVQDRWWVQLIHKIKTRPIGPQETMAVSGLVEQRYRGIVLDDLRLSEACEALATRKASPPPVYVQFGDYALKFAHDEGMADRMFVAAIERDPSDAAYANQILGALATDGRARQAGEVLLRMRQLGLTSSSTATAIDE
jgi:hypothetical protein